MARIHDGDVRKKISGATPQNRWGSYAQGRVVLELRNEKGGEDDERPK